MRCVSLQYFEDSRKKGYAPGDVVELEGEELEKYTEKNFVRVVNTRMVKQPETRRGRPRRKKNEKA